ncbi:MAG: zf-HC2 domain-containing protein [Anaerolineae bacterium]
MKRRDNKTEHGYFEERLSAYLDGELLPREKEAVEQHLVGCSSCRWEVETLRQTVQWTAELPAVSIPRVFTIPVQAEPVPVRRRWRLVPALQAATALVALLLFFAVAGESILTGSLPLSAPMAGESQEAARVVETVVVEKEMEKVVQEVPEAMVGAEEPVGEEAPLALEAPAAEMEVTQEMEPMMAVAPEGENLQSTPGIGGGVEPEEVEATTAADLHDDAALSPTPALQGTQAPPEAPAPAEPAAQTETPRALVPPTPTPLSSLAPAPTVAALAPTVAAPGTAVAAPGTAVAAPGTAVAAPGTAVAAPGTAVAAAEAPPPAQGGGLLATDEARSPAWLRMAEYVLGVALILLTGTTIALMVWRRQVR